MLPRVISRERDTFVIATLKSNVFHPLTSTVGRVYIDKVTAMASVKLQEKYRLLLMAHSELKKVMENQACARHEYRMEKIIKDDGIGTRITLLRHQK